MAQYMKDIDITDPITSFKPLCDGGSTVDKKVLRHEKEEMDVVFLHESCDREVERHKNEQIQNNKLHGTQLFEKAFPWLVTFDKVMHSSIGKKSFYLLEQLLTVYVNNISKSMETNYIMTYEIIKLKKHLNNTLTFFHFYWHDIIKEHVSDHNSYLNKISVLLAIYIDTELRTSKRNKDPSKVAAKLFSALWIYLNKSEEHIFKVLLRIKLITKRYAKICDPIFTKSFTNIKTNQGSLTDIQYVRYLLILKLWRKIKEDTEGEQNIVELAVKVLGSHMPKMHTDLLKLLPKLPLNCENETVWLMQPNLFDLKQACNDFLMYEENIEIVDHTKLSSTIKTTGTYNANNLEINSDTMEDKEKCSINYTSNKSPKIDFNEGRLFQDICKENNYFIKNSVKERVNKIKKSKFVPNTKSGEIIVIDFSKEDEECISSNKRKKNKCKTNLGWLRIVAKRCKTQKNLKCKSQTGTTDVCSTDHSVDLKHIQQCSDNKDNKNIKNINVLKKEQFLNDLWHINPKQECDDHKNCDHCVSLLRSQEKQFSNILHLLIALKLVGQNTKDPANLLNILKEYKEKNVMSFINTFLYEKDPDVMTVLLKIFENGLIKPQFNEIQLQTDHNATKNTGSWKNDSINECKENYLLSNIMSDKDYNLQTTEVTKKQNLSHTVNVNPNCCDKIDINSCSNNDYFNTSKIKETVPDTTYNNETDIKPIVDKKIVSILSDLERCMHVLGRISKHFMNVHIKKSDMECLSEKTDLCADSTTVIQDQVAESLNHCISQNLNVLNSPEIHQILKLCDQKNEMKNCNNLHSRDMCIPTQEGYGHEEYKLKKKASTDPNKFFLNENQQSTKCRLPKNVDCDVIKEEVEKTQDSFNSIRNLKCSVEQLQKTDNYQTFTVNTKTQMETCTFESQESETFPNYERNYLSLLNDYSQPAVEDNLIKIDSMVDYENVDILDSVLDTAVNRDFLDDVKNIDIKKDTDADIINKENILEDSQSFLTSLIDQDSFCNVLNSNEQIVSPYLIKKCVEEKTSCADKSSSEINAEWYSQESLENIIDTPVMKKSEQCNYQKNSVGRCVDIVAFDLNAKEEEDFDLFALDDSGSISILKNISSTCSSPLLIQSEIKISESREVSPKCTSNDMKMEQVYDFEEVNVLKEDGLKMDTTNEALINEACTSRDIPSNVLINYFPIQTEDLHTSSYNCTSVYPLQLDLESLPTEQLIEAPNLSLPFGQHDLTSYNPLSLDSQSIFTENDSLTTQQLLNGLQSIEPYELIQQNIKISSDNNQLYTNQKDTSQVSLSSHVSMDRGRLSKVIENSNNLWKQVELPELNDTLPQKKRILMNFQDKLCLKPSKGNVTRSDTQISKVPVVKENSLEEIATKISIRPNIRRLDITSFNGEASEKIYFLELTISRLLATHSHLLAYHSMMKAAIKLCIPNRQLPLKHICIMLQAST
ncbi:hypothetical protein KPH14_008879 [Odynerus spinipes]|uniref:Uncharacterized protein n=1 Tax=Odynerus spinipes TaxID=1348599 RepID=A0AAD9RFG5_9HYME|nr:hypothetical protein KPH14_008879 [Odynerus spinipes]